MKKTLLILACAFFSNLDCTDAFTSVFGDKIVGVVEDQVAIKFDYTMPTDVVNITIVATGTAIQTGGYLKINTGTNSAGSSIVQSKDSLHYSPGHEGSLFITGAFVNGGAANSHQYVGLFDANDGWAIGYNGTQFGVLFRRDNGTDTFISQANFNVDKIDGTGASGFDIDPTMLNIFRIVYGWLGAATISFQVCTENQVWVTFHQILYPNSAIVPSVENPTLPVRTEVTNTGNTTDLEVHSACWKAGIIGESSFLRQFIFVREDKDIMAANTDYVVCSLRNKTTFPTANPQPNKKAVDIVLTVFGTEENFLVKFKLFKNATLTGASFTDFNATLSSVETDIAATAYSGGILVFSSGAQRDCIKNVYLKNNDYKIRLNPGDVLTMVANSPLSNQVADVYVVWDEIE
ncbi:MAG: hypothetical protein UR26_C0002G0004 [candidate division TM6 bacterium GW2011_GWF2_32_72]|nr:MAG: hypothetical protein UR26_C0002G0004 [candidate division TM6 bacterium GW2011_GWF2_32_72]